MKNRLKRKFKERIEHKKCMKSQKKKYEKSKK